MNGELGAKERIELVSCDEHKKCDKLEDMTNRNDGYPNPPCPKETPPRVRLDS